ncbi:MAG: O-antigen ligase family protein [Actinomycetia bacterium]|nr:O-antigen ligase family protein [Actinomycetes bacterium]
MALAAGAATLAGVATLGLHRPLLLAVAPVAGIGLVFAARRPLLALVVMVVVEITNMGGVLSPSGDIPIFKASILLGVLAVSLALRDREARKRLNGWTRISIGILAVFFATQMVATVGSSDVAQSIAGIRDIALDCLFMVLVLVLVQLTARLWTVAAAFVIPFAVLSALSAINQFVFGGTMSFGGFSTVTAATGELATTPRYGGPLPDSNFWGRSLVMGLPLAAALLTRALRGRRRLIAMGWALAILAQLVGIYLTQSRGTFLCAGAAIAVWFIASERSVRRGGLAVLPLAVMAFLVPGVGNRLIAVLDDVTGADQSASVDPSVLGRLAAQQQAWMMFQERPYFGFGPATFPGQVIEFAGRVPTAVRDPAGAPHNIYLEFLALSGVTGLLGLALVILGFLTLATLRIVAEPRSPERVLAAAVCAAIIGWSLSSIFLHSAYFRTFTVLLALAVGVAPAWPVPGEVVRTFLRRVAVWSAAAIIGLSASGLCLAATSTPVVHATQRMTLSPVGPLDGWYAYALDIRSRSELLPTFALLFHNKGSPVDVEPDVARGLLTFTVAADTADKARDEIQLAVAHAETVLNESIGYNQYALTTVGSMRASSAQEHSHLASIGSGLVGVGAALVAGLVLSRRARGHHPKHLPAPRRRSSYRREPQTIDGS